ncbi:MAG: DinB family protein [Spirochaetaceae bacterium]|nr:MAG: DinB family protein [Spirochaetaceae bacterium]
MLAIFELIIEQSEREFRGHTFNGYSLMETLRPLSASTAASRDTYEGYSAWENLIHCVFFKFHLTRFLGAAETLLPYPWQEGSFPPIPDTSEHAWQAALDYAEKVHDTYIAVLQKLSVHDLERRIEEWECSVREAIIWMPAHDTYHVAQIRNMGLPELCSPREFGSTTEA